jgi:3-hydroxybutyryl-CoA dehydrogenase
MEERSQVRPFAPVSSIVEDMGDRRRNIGNLNMKNRSSRAVSRAQNRKPELPARIPAAVIGMGLMGRSIAACLLSAGHPVTGVTSDPKKIATTRRQLRSLLREMQSEGLLRGDPERILDRLTVTTNYADLSGCRLVVESIIEDIEAKKATYARVEDVVAPDAIIGSNTSSIRVT